MICLCKKIKNFPQNVLTSKFLSESRQMILFSICSSICFSQGQWEWVFGAAKRIGTLKCARAIALLPCRGISFEIKTKYFVKTPHLFQSLLRSKLLQIHRRTRTHTCFILKTEPNLLDVVRNSPFLKLIFNIPFWKSYFLSLHISLFLSLCTKSLDGSPVNFN